jgi:Icc-related predicted phosphoesterase
MSLKIACVSDVHGLYNCIKWPKADVLVMAGDLCPNFYSDKHRDAQRQGMWLEMQFAPMLRMLGKSYKKIFIVPGNHDKVFAIYPKKVIQVLGNIKGVHVLVDSAVKYDGKKFYGSPWSSWFHGDHWVFNLPDISDPVDIEARKKIRVIWENIPDDTDVLITHGPARGYLDKTDRGELVGCPILAYEVQNRVKPALHIVGHIHEDAGMMVAKGRITVNASYVNLQCDPTNPIQVIEI